MKSFKNFNEAYSSAERKAHSGKSTRSVRQNVDALKKGLKAVGDYLAPPASRSNEPTVRSGERDKNTGFGYVPSRDKKGERYDKTGTPAPAKLDKGTRGETMPSNPQFKGVGARTKPKTDKKRKSDDGGGRGSGGDRSAPPKSKKRSAKDDPRNAKYNAMRSDLAKSTFKTKKDRDGATKATEKVGMDAWAKANPKLAAAKKKRDATRGTSKSDNPLMKKYIKDRESRGERLQKISKQAKADTIANSPNAASINKKQTERQASVDKAIKSVNAPKTPEASAKTPTPALANKGSGRSGGFGTGTFGGGMPSNPPVRAKTPAPAAAPAPPTVKVGDKVGYSKGGEVKKKTKKESFLGFGEYLAEKKTKIKLNPKKEDMLEKTMKPEKGEDCHCDHTKNEKKKRKEDTDHTEGTPEVSNESINQEVLAYVSQEEVSEESHQESYETETDLTEALPGSTNVSYYDSKKDFKKAFKSNPGAFKSALPSTGGRPGGTIPRGRPGLYTGKDAYKPMPAFQQKMMYKSGLGQKLMGGDNKKGFWSATMKANNAQVGSPSSATSGPKKSGGGSNSKPASTMNANRPGFDSKGRANKSEKDKLSGKKTSYSGFTETKKLKSFGSISSMNEEQLDEIFGAIAKAVGSIFKGAKKVVQPKPQQQPQAQQQQKPSDAQRFASLSAPSQSVGKLSAGPVKVNPSSTADAASQAIDKVSTPTPKPVDPKLDKPEKTKSEKKKKAEDEKLKGKSAAMTKEEIELDERTRYAKETGKSAKTGRESKRGGRGAPSGAVAAVMADITKRYGKGAIAGTGQQSKKKKGEKKEGEGGKYQKMADRKKKTADDAKKRGFKSSQDYVNTMARYGGKDNYDRGRGLGT